MKRLTKIRLVNWHYFANETIEVDGSFLITGENSAGKSTILDAIQLVLTTNTRKFNLAANDKSKRNLKGYVHCKVGDELKGYLRKEPTITYVALEFFEESKSNYFTVGVKIDSRSIESSIDKRWFCEECEISNLSFLTGNKPSNNKQFKKGGNKIELIKGDSRAKDRFRVRFGHLEPRFFDMIPKSLAFKPMDNVKDFINKFILQEKHVEIKTLRENINTLKEFEDLVNLTKEKIEALEQVNNSGKEINEKRMSKAVNRVMLDKAKLNNLDNEINNLSETLNVSKATKVEKTKAGNQLDVELTKSEELKNEYTIAAANNETNRAIDKLESDLNNKNEKLTDLKIKFKCFLNAKTKLEGAIKFLEGQGLGLTSVEEYKKIFDESSSFEDRNLALLKLDNSLKSKLDEYRKKKYQVEARINDLKKEKYKCDQIIKDLNNKKMEYPDNTVRLKNAIEKHFEQLGIDTRVSVFCELCEITDPRWQNAIEGYLNTQRFNLVIDPRYYDEALKVYHKNRGKIHSVGLVNIKKLDQTLKVDNQSLAYLISCKNSFAKAYANFLLNKVIRVKTISELKDYKTAITSDCMLYKNHTVKKINSRIYEVPFFGESAFVKQLKYHNQEQVRIEQELKKGIDTNNAVAKVIGIIDELEIRDIKDNLGAPSLLEKLNVDISEAKANIKELKNDPSIIEMQFKVDEIIKKIKRLKVESKGINGELAVLDNRIIISTNLLKDKRFYFTQMNINFEELCAIDSHVTKLGLEKYEKNAKKKSIVDIENNFARTQKRIDTEISLLTEQLLKYQTAFNNRYESDIEIGVEAISLYEIEQHKLLGAKIIEYEDRLLREKEKCEIQFKESFLVNLKEHIESARIEFNSLNKSLNNIYYGEDSYKFLISKNKNKAGLYDMIMSADNLGGDSIFSGGFEEKYHDEMEDLFLKLTAYDDKGERVVNEYTDYRSYLDYDISIEKKNGSREKFSKIYGEKSGGETQTPYYVSIAASFAQIYKNRDSIRLIMLDEAFDKMDEGRIDSMLDFFKQQNFQVIIATPPSKMETIGEKVDTILLARRFGDNSIIEVYDL